jgi:hypothetical protein
MRSWSETHIWFAWYPVMCTNYYANTGGHFWIWLEDVERWKDAVGAVRYRLPKEKE